MTKDEFIANAGFKYGWKELESWARRMAEYGTQEIEELLKEAGALRYAIKLERGKTEKADAENQRLHDSLALTRRALQAMVDRYGGKMLESPEIMDARRVLEATR